LVEATDLRSAAWDFCRSIKPSLPFSKANMSPAFALNNFTMGAGIPPRKLFIVLGLHLLEETNGSSLALLNPQ
jgi:hypothetical protein